MTGYVRRGITLPAALDEEIRVLAEERGASQSSLITHLVRLGLAAEASGTIPSSGTWAL